MNTSPVDINVVEGQWQNDECLRVLFDNENMRVEHVLMPNKSSPSGFWYDVAEDEWGLLMAGNVSFQYDNYDSQITTLHKGEQFFIPRHKKHRILSTSQDCVVLCVFIK